MSIFLFTTYLQLTNKYTVVLIELFLNSEVRIMLSQLKAENNVTINSLSKLENVSTN